MTLQPFFKLIWGAPPATLPDPPKKILLLRVGAMGDVIMTTPTIDAIKQKYPDAALDFACGEWSASILPNNPSLSRVIPFPDSWVFEKRLFKMRLFAKKLGRNGYEMGIFFDKSWHWSMFAAQTDIPYRIGFDRDGEGFGYHAKIPYSADKPEYISNLTLAQAAGCAMPQTIAYSLFPSDEDTENARAFLQKYHLKSFIGIAPGGANNPGHIFHEKRWKAERYVEIIKSLSASHPIILFGGNDDKALCDDIIHKSVHSVVSCAGALTALESVALMQHAKLFVTHDSGAMHMASAAGCPVPALFGPTPPTRFAPPKVYTIYPYGGSKPCYDALGTMKNCTHAGRCMDAVTVEAVLAKIREIL